MAEIKITASEVEKAKQLSSDIYKELNHTYQLSGELKSYLESAVWHGKTKDAFHTYLSLIYKYHKDLIDIMSDHENAIKKLETCVNEYDSSSEVASIRGL